MYNEEGETTWQRSLDSNGKAKQGDNSTCPFLYQGQYYDEETELAYNRFRYYDPEDGRYISQDPIGLASGEFGFYNYVEDTNIWIDGLGLNSTKLGTKIGAVTGDGLENHHLIPEQVWKDNQQMFDDLGMDMDGKKNGRLVAGSERKRLQSGDQVFHRGSHPQYSHSTRSPLSKIKRKWKPGINDQATIKRIRRLQRQLNAEIREGKVPRSKKTYSKIG